MKNSKFLSIFTKNQSINNNTKKNQPFKKYQLPEQFTFQELVANFTDFLRNNSVFIQKEKKKCLFEKYQPWDKYIF